MGSDPKMAGARLSEVPSVDGVESAGMRGLPALGDLGHGRQVAAGHSQSVRDGRPGTRHRGPECRQLRVPGQGHGRPVSRAVATPLDGSQPAEPPARAPCASLTFQKHRMESGPYPGQTHLTVNLDFEEKGNKPWPGRAVGRASSGDTKAVGPIPRQGTQENAPMDVWVGGTTNRCFPLPSLPRSNQQIKKVTKEIKTHLASSTESRCLWEIGAGASCGGGG